MNSTQPTALVTGANKGIGFETARQLAQQGFTVWLGCRDRDRGEAAAKELAADGDVRLVILDVTDDESVSAAAAQIGELDVLINNAGIALSDGEGPASTMTPEALRKSFDVNYFGALRVTQTFLPLVRRSAAGRIVNVSSTVASMGVVTSAANPFAGYPAVGYATSKALTNTLTGWFATELRDTSIKINSVCPGYNATDMNGHQGTQHPSEGAKVVVRAATLPADGPSGTFFDVNGTVNW